MCWNIRRCSSHNLQPCLHRSGPHDLARSLPHASKHSQCPSAILEHAVTKCSYSLACNQPHMTKHPKILRRTWNPVSTEAGTGPGWLFTSCLSYISRCSISNHWRQLHKVNNTFLRKPCCMYWNIRRCSSTTLDYVFHRSDPHNLTG